MDAGCVRMNRVEELHAGAFFHHQVATAYRVVDFCVCANDQVAEAFDRAMDAADEGEVVTAKAGGVEYAVFANDYIPASLNAAIAESGDFVAEKAEIAAAFRTLA
jgi:hypothetical protein